MRPGRPNRNERRPLKVSVCLRLPLDVAQALADEAFERRVDRSDVAIAALRQYLAHRVAAEAPVAAATG